jgi:putative ABC transport system permease protein
MSGGFTYLEGGDPVNDDDMTVDKYYAQQKHTAGWQQGQAARSRLEHPGLRGREAGPHLREAASALQAITGSPGHLTVIYAKLDDPKLATQVVEDLKAKLPGYQIYTMDELTSMYSISNVAMLKDFIGW